jgi:hypothetical protein|tara:strand:- start:580 stop:690 length:111 start_codon:yes stop_codon:yes gene_type:complete
MKADRTSWLGLIGIIGILAAAVIFEGKFREIVISFF